MKQMRQIFNEIHTAATYATLPSSIWHIGIDHSEMAHWISGSWADGF